MPELPEVETIVRELNSKLISKKIIHCEILRPQIIKHSDDYFTKSLVGSKIKTINRRGKYIISID